MEQAASSAFLVHRSFIQASSCQACVRVHTTEAVRGGGSARSANGSAFSKAYPERGWILSLYRSPLPSPGMKHSQTPESPRGYSGESRDVQPLKSPTTCTLVA